MPAYITPEGAASSLLQPKEITRGLAALFSACGYSESVDTSRRVMKQSLALGGGVALGDAFKCVPNRDVGI